MLTNLDQALCDKRHCLYIFAMAYLFIYSLASLLELKEPDTEITLRQKYLNQYAIHRGFFATLGYYEVKKITTKMVSLFSIKCSQNQLQD